MSENFTETNSSNSQENSLPFDETYGAGADYLPAPSQQSPLQYPPQQQYGHNPYLIPTPYAPLNMQGGGNNWKATVALIVGISSLLGPWLVPSIGIWISITAIVFGHIAVKEAKNGTMTGYSHGVAGMVCGYIALGLGIIVFVLAMILAQFLSQFTNP